MNTNTDLLEFMQLCGIAEDMAHAQKIISKRLNTLTNNGSDEPVQPPVVDVSTLDLTNPPTDNTDDTKSVDHMTGTKVEIPSDVISQIDKRIAELEDAIKVFDTKGFNDGETIAAESPKSKAIDCLKQLKTNLEKGTLEGVHDAKIYIGTLRTPFGDMIPPAVYNFIFKSN